MTLSVVVFVMSFPRAAVKRFNETSSATPAPTDYDPKDPTRARGSYAPEFRAQRFSDSKDVTPGPGQYDAVVKQQLRVPGQQQQQQHGTAKKKVGPPLLDSHGQDDVFKTPCWQGPRTKLTSSGSRRSRAPPMRSSSNSSLGSLDASANGAGAEDAAAAQLKLKCAELEAQVAQLRAKLREVERQQAERSQQVDKLKWEK